MPQPNQIIPNYMSEIWTHRRALRQADVGKKSEQKLTRQQIEDFRRVGKISQEEATLLLMELIGLPETTRPTPEQIDELKQGGIISDMEATQLLAEYNGHKI